MFLDIPKYSRISQTLPETPRYSQVLFWGCSGVVLGLFWGCSGVVLGLFWGCCGVILGLFWGCSGGVLGLRRSFNIQKRRQGNPGQFRELDPMKATPTAENKPAIRDHARNARPKSRPKRAPEIAPEIAPEMTRPNRARTTKREHFSLGKIKIKVGRCKGFPILIRPSLTSGS